MKIAIIGSGTSAIMAAQSFLKKEFEVHMFESSGDYEKKNEIDINFFPKFDRSPKFNNTNLMKSIQKFGNKYNLYKENFFSSSVLSIGGLSNFWGGGIEFPDEDYLNKYVKKNEIIKFKNELDKEIGLNLDPYEFYNFFYNNRKVRKFLDIKNKTEYFDKLALAINQNDFKGLSKEKYLENCNYISENIFYNAKEQIQKLLDHKLFFLKKNCFVENIILKNEKNYLIINSKLYEQEFDKIILCCGTVGSSILVSKILSLNSKMRLFHTPMITLSYLSTNLFNRIKIKEKFGIALLKLNLEINNLKFKGSFMPANNINNNFFGISEYNFILSLVKKSMYVGNLFFPQSLSNTYIKTGQQIKIENLNNDDVINFIPKIKKKINLFLKNFNLLPIPLLNCKLSENGSDAHYTSSLYGLKVNEKKVINENCELIERKNIHILDGSIIADGLFYPTYFTMMYIKYLSNRIVNEKKN